MSWYGQIVVLNHPMKNFLRRHQYSSALTHLHTYEYIKVNFRPAHNESFPFQAVNKYLVMSRDLSMKNVTAQIELLQKEANALRTSLAALTVKEKKYRQFFETASDAFIVFDVRSQQIEDVNFSALQLFGFSKEELIHTPFGDVCAEKEQILSAALHGSSKIYKEKQIITARFIRKDGSGFPGAVFSYGFESRGKIKILASIRDISEKLKTEEKLQKSQEQLFQAQKMESLGILVAGVAHEINNPINLIMYNIPLMKKIWNDFKPVFKENENKHPNTKYGGLTYRFINENMDQLIDDMDMAAKRVETIVNRLKDFSRKSNTIEKSDMSINDAVKNALRLAQSTLKKSNVALHEKLPKNIPLIKGHLQSIEQVVLNLLINANESIDHDQGKIQISTEFLESEKTILLKVQDNGKGMSSDTLEKIFDPFFTKKQAEGGTGLGLSVTYSLIKTHGGEIACQSRQGEGTLFTVSLPLDTEKKPFKILIVDDDKSIQKLLRQALKKAGNYSIGSSYSGTEALIKLGTDLPDLLILDLFMPQMNGLAVCRTIIKEEKLSKTKVIIITGMPDSREIEEIKKIGFHHICPKPIDIKQFVKDVDQLLTTKEGF